MRGWSTIICAGAIVLASGMRTPAEDVPYGIDQRAAPTGQDVERILPLRVGNYARSALPRGIKPSADSEINVDYAFGRDVINVGFGLTDSPDDAHDAIRTAKQEAEAELKRRHRTQDLARAQESIGTDPSYFKLDDFIAWSRDGYFFYAKANSPSALDRFMTSFPY